MMTSKRVLAALALAALPAASAFAQSAQQNINLTATVAKFCRYDGSPRFEALTNFTVGGVGVGSSTISVTAATNATGVMNDANFRVKIAATCNHPSTVTLLSVNGGLKDASLAPITPGSVFLSRIDYEARLSEWDNAGLVVLQTDGTANSSVSSNSPIAHTGDVVVLVDLDRDTSAPLAAGNYSDVLRISLTPQ